MTRRLRRAYLLLRYCAAELQYVCYRGPHGYRLNQRAARRLTQYRSA